MSLRRFCLGVLVWMAAGGAGAAPASAPPSSASEALASAPAPQAAIAPQAAPAPIPFRHDAAVPAASLSGGAIGLLLVSLLAIGAIVLVRKRLNLHGVGGAAPRLVRVIETERLGPRALLSVVAFGGKLHLIAQSEHGISCLVSAAPDETTAQGESV